MSCDAAGFEISPIAPAAIALLSALVRGVTGFGDGVTYQTLWSLSAAVGLLPAVSCYSMRKTVLYSTLMQTLTMPMQAWQARKSLPIIAGYAVLMACVGSVFVYAGASLLLSSSASEAVRMVAGVIFLLFSTVQLTGKALTYLRKRAADATPAAVGSPTSPPCAASAASTAAEPSSQSTAAEAEEDGEGEGERQKLMAADSVAVVAVELPQVRERSASVGAAPHAEAAEAATTLADAATASSCTSSSASSPQSSWLSARWFPALSQRYSPGGMLALLLPASCLGGFIGGAVGAGGPPLMAAYSLLRLDKDVLRGFGIVPSVFMCLRLAMYTGSSGAVFDPSPDGELRVYVAILVAAIAGSSAGNRLRAHVDSELALTLILLLVFFGSGALLRLFVDPVTTAVYVIGAVVWLALFALLWARPQLLVRWDAARARR